MHLFPAQTLLRITALKCFKENKKVLIHCHYTYKNCLKILTDSEMSSLYFCPDMHSYTIAAILTFSPRHRHLGFGCSKRSHFECITGYMFACACVWWPCPVALWETAVVWLPFCFLECLSLSISILRGWKPHIHRASNPLNVTTACQQKVTPKPSENRLQTGPSLILPAHLMHTYKHRFPNSLGLTPSLPLKSSP